MGLIYYNGKFNNFGIIAEYDCHNLDNVDFIGVDLALATFFLGLLFFCSITCVKRDCYKELQVDKEFLQITFF